MITSNSSTSSDNLNPYDSVQSSSRRGRRSKSCRRTVFNFLVLPLFLSPFMLQFLYLWRFVPSNYGVPSKVHEYLPSFVRTGLNSPTAVNETCTVALPGAYCGILHRAKNFHQFCSGNISNSELSNHPNGYQGPPIETDLAPFGIIETLERFITNYTLKNSDSMANRYNFTCSLPPEKSCHVEKVSLITMGYK